MSGSRTASLLLLAGFVLAARAGGTNQRPRFHEDPQRFEASALAATRAVLLDDPAALRPALDDLHRACRILMPEQAAVYGESIVNADRAFHAALARGREHAGAGEGQESFEAFVGIIRVCRGCHEFARAQEPGTAESTEP